MGSRGYDVETSRQFLLANWLHQMRLSGKLLLDFVEF